MGIVGHAAFHRSLFFPRAEASPPPLGARDFFVEVPGARLHVREHPGPARALLLFHGNGEVVADYDESVAQFAAAGVRLVVVDYRGYGQSTGEPTLASLLSDAPLVLAEVARAVETPLFVMGRSLGGNAAAELCQLPRPGVLGYVFESAPTDLDALVSRRGFDPRALSESERREFGLLAKLARCASRALFLHGADDELVRPREALAGHAAVPGSELVLVPGRGHNDLSLSSRYWEALARFVRG
jgi:pimeloyl-ACP methyl ester carboxylesterase